MNDAANKIKQQIVDKIKASTNILVTVSQNPSVDELSAAIGLATIINKLDKHATTIFSGTVPAAINFLNPDKVFENSVDSLRDFIISLDKEKADHLRYKVEGDMVKIFITPYRTVITGDDLEFSQGDFNVELVLALGVSNQEHLDNALAAHGRILHDVTIATLTAGDQSSELGNFDWHDQTASGLSEMVVAVGQALKTDKPILDKQIATALLTGIVSSTDRFSNPRTSATVMTIAAQLMASGADQQLIAAKLQESHELSPNTPIVDESVLSVNTEPVVEAVPIVETVEEASTLPPDGLMIDHPTDTEVPAEVDTSNTVVSDFSTMTPQPEVDTTMPQPGVAMPEYIDNSTLAPAYAPESIEPIVSTTPTEIAEPSFGGTLNATADQAAEEARQAIEDQQNSTILNHSYLGQPVATVVPEVPLNGVGQPEDTKTVDIFAANSLATSLPPIEMPLPPTQMPDFSTLPPPPLPDFSVPAPNSIPTIQPLNPINDPSQFRIPGQQ